MYTLGQLHKPEMLSIVRSVSVMFVMYLLLNALLGMSTATLMKTTLRGEIRRAKCRRVQ